LAEYSTDVLLLPEPNKHECVISAHLFATGVEAEVQGIDLSEWVGSTTKPIYCSFKELNTYLEKLRGAGSAFVWVRYTASRLSGLHSHPLCF
jgi:hypothetical protein